MVRFSLPPNLDYSSSQSLLLSYQERLVWKGKQRKRRAAIIAAVLLSQRTTIIGRNPNRHDVDYPQVVGRILRLKLNPRLFTRMFRLSPASFDRVLSFIDPVLRPVGVGGKNIVPPIKIVVSFPLPLSCVPPHMTTRHIFIRIYLKARERLCEMDGKVKRKL